MNNLGGMNDYQARQVGINPTHLCKLFFLQKLPAAISNRLLCIKRKAELTSQGKGKLTMSGEREL